MAETSLNFSLGFVDIQTPNASLKFSILLIRTTGKMNGLYFKNMWLNILLSLFQCSKDRVRHDEKFLGVDLLAVAQGIYLLPVLSLLRHYHARTTPRRAHWPFSPSVSPSPALPTTRRSSRSLPDLLPPP